MRKGKQTRLVVLFLFLYVVRVILVDQDDFMYLQNVENALSQRFHHFWRVKSNIIQQQQIQTVTQSISHTHLDFIH